MSSLVVVVVKADVEKFKAFAAENGEVMKQIAERGRAAGAIHHRFGAANGNVVVIDEWENGDEFQKFFGDPDIAKVMQESGAQGEPQVFIVDALDTPDQF
jgi:hypothetical protein